jgi:uncharacterized protein (UPF0371 family)
MLNCNCAIQRQIERARKAFPELEGIDSHTISQLLKRDRQVKRNIDVMIQNRVSELDKKVYF